MAFVSAKYLLEANKMMACEHVYVCDYIAPSSHNATFSNISKLFRTNCHGAVKPSFSLCFSSMMCQMPLMSCREIILASITNMGDIFTYLRPTRLAIRATCNMTCDETDSIRTFNDFTVF